MKKQNLNKGSHTSHFPPHTSSNGITLIALVITIIVMLILVTVSVTMAINGGLFGYAKNAVDETDIAKGAEQNLGSGAVEVDEKKYDNIDDYLAGKEHVEKVVAGQKASVNSEYTSGGKTAVIPAKFTVSGKASESTIDGGLVIYLIDDKTDEEIAEIDWENDTTLQTKYDQFVWIPIAREDINDMYMCQSEGTDTDGSGTVEDDEYNTCRITVENGEAKCTTHNSNKMAGRLYATTYGETFDATYKKQTYKANSGLREPAIVIGSAGTSYDGSSTYLTQLSGILGTTGYDTSANFLASLQKEYNEIVKSVYENQGFYVGRYETSNMTITDGTAVKVVAGITTGINNINWYYMYAQQKEYATNKGVAVKSAMIQGAAYDQVMKFVNGYNGYSVTTNNGKGNNSGGVVKTTGCTMADQAKNIFDLEGNLYAWTTEAVSTNGRVYRGGDYSNSNSASYRGYVTPHYNSNDLCRFISSALHMIVKCVV